MRKRISRCALSEMFLGKKIPGNSRSTGCLFAPLRRPQPGSNCRKERPPHLLCADLLCAGSCTGRKGGVQVDSGPAPGHRSFQRRSFCPRVCMRDAVPIPAGKAHQRGENALVHKRRKPGEQQEGVGKSNQISSWKSWLVSEQGLIAARNDPGLKS